MTDGAHPGSCSINPFLPVMVPSVVFRDTLLNDCSEPRKLIDTFQKKHVHWDMAWCIDSYTGVTKNKAVNMNSNIVQKGK